MCQHLEGLGASGVREPPPWPWAIKVHQGIFHTLMVQKLKAQRAPALPLPPAGNWDSDLKGSGRAVSSQQL